MADQHFEWTESSNPGANLKEACRNLETAWNMITRQRGVLIQSKDVGGVGDDAFATIATRYDFAPLSSDTAVKKAEASAFFAEMDSMFAADAAVSQFLNRTL